MESESNNPQKAEKYQDLIYEIENRDFEFQNLVIQYHQACKINKTYLNSEIQEDLRLDMGRKSKRRKLIVLI